MAAIMTPHGGIQSAGHLTLIWYVCAGFTRCEGHLADSLHRERPLPQNAKTGPTNHKPAALPAKAEEGAVFFSLVQHAQ